MKKVLVLLLSAGMVFSAIDFGSISGSSEAQAQRRSSSFSRSRSFSRPSSRPSTRPSSRPSTRPSTPSSRPSTRSSTNKKPTGKPSGSTFDSRASSASKKATSAQKFKRSSAPKPNYTSKNGKTVKIDPKSSSTKHVRSMSSSDYSNRSTRIEKHYHHHYGDRYDYYRSQPYVYVGGGYSSLFWYSMLDWDLRRRALWMYHHQNTIDSQLYATQMQNAQLAAEINRLKAQNVAVDPNYVDKEYAGNEDLMYSNEYVKAAYNQQPAPVVHKPVSLTWLWWTLGILFFGGLIVWLVFIKQW